MTHSRLQAATTQHSVTLLEDLAGVCQKLAPQLRAGDVITLDGHLGAGKTTLVQTLCAALGVTEHVTSPTFNLIHEYTSGRLPIVHADVYRLGESAADSLADDLSDMIEAGDALVLVEWACYTSFLDFYNPHQISLELAQAPDGAEARMLTLTSVRLSL